MNKHIMSHECEYDSSRRDRAVLTSPLQAVNDD